MNGKEGPFSCDPTITAPQFDVGVGGYFHDGAASLHLTLAAQESNEETDCGAHYTAFGTTSTRLTDSLTAVGGDHMRLSGVPIAPVLRKHTVEESGSTKSTVDDEWHFSATCSGDCLPDPVKVRQEQKENAEKAAAAYRDAIKTDHAQVNALCPAGGNREAPFACVPFEAKLIYDEAMLADAEALAKDPPSHRFKAIARPHPLKLKRLRVRGAGVTNALLSNYGQVGGLLRALLATINRADGAAVAGSRHWTQGQNRAARRYASGIVGLLHKQGGLARRAERSLVRAHMVSRHRAAGLADANSRRAASILARALRHLH